MLYIFVKHYIFKENAICLKETIRREGYECQITDRFDYDKNNLYIIFGAHDLIEKFPNKYIIYQLEQSNVGYYNIDKEFIENNYKTFNKNYICKLQNAFEVWEYSQENMLFFSKINQKLDVKIKCRYVPLCYSDYLTQLTKNVPDKDIDILFFGSLNERRLNILNQLKNNNINIEIHSNLLGEEKINKIMRSKIVLNIHFYEESLLETHRINYLLANKCFIISEYSRDQFEDSNYKDKIIFCKYNEILNTCLKWLNKSDKDMNYIRENGYIQIKKKNFKNYIEDILPTISDKNIQSNTKKKHKKINYYFPSEIDNAEVEKINGGAVLKLDGINDDLLPNVTLITPTGNRRKMFSIAIRNFQSIIYPKNKIEWLIVDDGEETIEDLLPKDKRIKYIKLDVKKRLPIGEKRNVCVEMSQYNYIAFMDDDDYYSPENLIARIKTLLKYNKKCVGCCAVGNYNLINNQSLLATDGPMYLCEATLAFEKNFWKDRKFNDKDILGEYKYFQHHRQKEMISIPFQFVMIALNHKDNLTANKRNYDQDIYNKNKDNYTDLYEMFDYETQIFIEDIRKYLGIKINKKKNLQEIRNI